MNTNRSYLFQMSTVSLIVSLFETVKKLASLIRCSKVFFFLYLVAVCLKVFNNRMRQIGVV